jgi:putative transposase
LPGIRAISAPQDRKWRPDSVTEFVMRTIPPEKPHPLPRNAKAGLQRYRDYNRRVTRLRRISDRDRIFFITVCLGRGVTALTPSERDVVQEYIGAERGAGTFLLFGYVIMPDHFHLLIAPLAAGLQDGMHRLKMRTGRRIRTLRRESGPFWQPRYFDFILRRVADFWEKLQYIHDNPVSAKLVATREEWCWSSASHYARKSNEGMIDAIDLPAERSALLWPAPWR